MGEQLQKEKSPELSTNTRNLIILVVLILFGIGAIYYFDQTIFDQTTPDSVDPVAIVNGEEITLAEYEKTKEQISSSLEVEETQPTPTEKEIRTQTLSSLISRILISQRMKSHNIEVPEEDIAVRMAELKSNFETEEEFQAAISEQGITDEQMKEQISSEIQMRMFLEKEFGPEIFEISDNEIQQFYDENVAVLEDPLPLEEIREDVELLVLQQKQQEKLDELLQQLQLTSDIEIFI